ncbi:tetratricopeptide repeat protein [Opitutus terrae]|uniref:Tetratricopeptide TPR_2 repeat protein n=1 Tax=Opitutus terrae (strain DSM 11246 / JCM 15787 / PB90-1) TaxID=452637 RepID=B1ZUT0_OPITP|nr:tetratricopeptide repeat protein [Opitutus terrae]ACB74964.1 hypothetical protein Oter_1680 [Opitutus terrae PB90-1]
MKTKLLTLVIMLVTAAGLVAADDPLAAGAAALNANQLDTADALLTPLAAVEKPDPRVFLQLSELRVRQGRAKDAVGFAEKAVAAAPGEARLHSNLGRVLSVRIGEVNFLHQGLLAGRMREAFEKSIELDPEHMDGYFGLARYYTNAPAIVGGGREPAERYAREIEKRNPQLGTLELARIAERFGDPAGALVLYTKAATAQPDNAAIEESLGRVNEALGNAAAARPHYEKALALASDRRGAREALARLDAPKS